MPNAIRCIDKMFVFKNSGISSLALIFILSNLQSQNDNLERKKAVPGCDMRRVIFHFFQAIDTNLWLSGQHEALWGGQLGFDSRRILKLYAAPRPFCVSLSPSVHWHARFYIAALALIFQVFFLGFRQCRSRAERMLTLNMNIRLALFWSTWCRARGPDSATCAPAGLANGRNYSDCRDSEQKSQKVLGHCFPLNYRENKGPPWGFFNPHLPDWQHTLSRQDIQDSDSQQRQYTRRGVWVRRNLVSQKLITMITLNQIMKTNFVWLQLGILPHWLGIVVVMNTRRFGKTLLRNVKFWQCEQWSRIGTLSTFEHAAQHSWG